jgi:release factor glutamine methyltransferase
VSAPAIARAATAAEALALATRAVARVSDTPRLDAELLLAHALGVSRTELVMASGERPGAGAAPLAGVAQARLRELVRRRVNEREPVAYITGVRHFRRLAIAVDRRALIPRPETELLVEAALALPRDAAVLDLGTGSGAVALAIKDERPDLDVAGSDVSGDALALAAENGRRLGLEVEWIQADLLAGVPDRFDAIVSNPPYVAEHERDRLAPEILRHEPGAALFAGRDGLEVVRELLAALAPRARTRAGVPTGPGRVGRVALEVGAGQAGEVRALMLRSGFTAVRAVRDLAGIERVVVGERGSPGTARGAARRRGSAAGLGHGRP